MDDKELIAELGHVEVACCGEYWASGSHAVRLAAARLTALAEENERLRKLLDEASGALGDFLDMDLREDCNERVQAAIVIAKVEAALSEVPR